MVAQLLRHISEFARSDKHMTEVLQGASTGLVMIALALGLGFFVNVLLARLLGATNVGIYYLALDISTIAVTIATLGLNKAVLRFTAAHEALGEYDKVQGAFRKSIQLAAGLATISTILIILSAPQMAHTLFNEPRLALALRLMALIIIPNSLLFIYADALRGLKQIRDSLFLNNLGIPLLSIPLVVLLVKLYGLNGAVIARFSVTVILLFLGFAMWWRITRHQRDNATYFFSTRQLITRAIPFLGIDLTNLVMRRIDVIFLGIWSTSAAVGIYSVAIRVAVLTTIVLGAMNSIIAPKFAALHAKQDRTALEALMQRVTRLMTVLSLGFAAPLFLFPSVALQLFGTEFLAGTSALRILVIGQFINVAAGPVGILLLMSGHERIQTNNVIATAVLNILLNSLLIPPYGLIGAAVAASITLAVKNLVSIILVRRYLSIRVW